MLSQTFMQDSGSKFLVAPIISMKVVKVNPIAEGELKPGMSSDEFCELIVNKYDLVPTSPLAEKFSNLILHYS